MRVLWHDVGRGYPPNTYLYGLRGERIPRTFAVNSEKVIFVAEEAFSNREIMHKLGKYKGSERMCDLVGANYPMLLVMSRFGIALGFGDKTIAEVCADSGVDERVFLAIVNLLLGEEGEPVEVDPALDPGAVVEYLQNSHAYFLDFRLPAIRRKLIEAIDCGQSDLSFAILRFFDQYVDEVRRHMHYEDQTVFPYVRSLAGGHPDCYNIDIFRRRHDSVEARLTELKNILIKYYPARGSNELNSVLFDIFTCAEDLASHNRIEDSLLVPLVARLEREREGRR